VCYVRTSSHLGRPGVVVTTTIAALSVVRDAANSSIEGGCTDAQLAPCWAGSSLAQRIGKRQIHDAEWVRRKGIYSHPGSVNEKTLPWPTVLSTPTCPPSFSTMRRTMDSPSPCPSVRTWSSLVNGVNNRA
jgi:hypothetical protein